MKFQPISFPLAKSSKTDLKRQARDRLIAQKIQAGIDAIKANSQII